MKDHPAVLKYAHAFASINGMELDDALQDARLAHAKALRAIDTGDYDPRKASFNTYATTAVYHGMCSALSRSKRKIPEGYDPRHLGCDHGGWTEDESDVVPDESTPSPDRRLMLAELIRELPDDARAVVDLVLDDSAGELVDLVLDGANGAQDKLRKYIRQVLGLRRGDRASAAFSAIAEMLAEMGT
jgi:hypothetical protein